MTCVGGTGIELVASSVSGQAAGVAACVRLGADHCERSAQVRGCPAVCAAVVTQLDTRSRPDAVVLAHAHTAPEAVGGQRCELRSLRMMPGLDHRWTASAGR
jgi:hypothetical protein